MLPEVAETEDVTVQIHHKLVEAFCWENDIEVIKVSIYLFITCGFISLFRSTWGFPTNLFKININQDVVFDQ